MAKYPAQVMELPWMKVYPGALLMKAAGLSAEDRCRYYEIVFYLWQMEAAPKAELESRVGPIGVALGARLDTTPDGCLRLLWLDEERRKQVAVASKNSLNKSGKRSQIGISSGKTTRSSTGASTAVSVSSASSVVDAFAEFWHKYPKKEGKQDALKAWIRLSEGDRQRALDGIGPFCEGKEKKFIAFPATYLNGKRWEDHRETPQATNGTWNPRA